jgi:hypothetical protein
MPEESLKRSALRHMSRRWSSLRVGAASAVPTARPIAAGQVVGSESAIRILNGPGSGPQERAVRPNHTWNRPPRAATFDAPDFGVARTSVWRGTSAWLRASAVAQDVGVAAGFGGRAGRRRGSGLRRSRRTSAWLRASAVAQDVGVVPDFGVALDSRVALDVGTAPLRLPRPSYPGRASRPNALSPHAQPPQIPPIGTQPQDRRRRRTTGHTGRTGNRCPDTYPTRRRVRRGGVPPPAGLPRRSACPSSGCGHG